MLTNKTISSTFKIESPLISAYSLNEPANTKLTNKTISNTLISSSLLISPRIENVGNSVVIRIASLLNKEKQSEHIDC